LPNISKLFENGPPRPAAQRHLQRIKEREGVVPEVVDRIWMNLIDEKGGNCRPLVGGLVYLLRGSSGIIEAARETISTL
jgi:hypothetical protein